ncbi:Mu-like prophage major head subunit gpT family protein [Pseudorhodobacter sp.]|uniref:Mu-like prophage major head subunit gpT family protein n=1 Tax=Pseudorhodobacter sp. TaxID=1934400 RepID=UPI0034638D47
MREMILSGVQQILGFKDDQGEPMNESAREFLIKVPTAWFKNAAAAIKNSYVGGGDTNLMTNLDGFTFKLAVNPRLTWTDKLAVFRTDGQTKPFIMQEEEGVTVSAIAEGSELEFKEDRHEYGVKAIRNVGYGYWQHSCLVQAV